MLGSESALADISLSLSLSAWPCHAFIRWHRFQMDPICRIHSSSSGGGGGTCMGARAAGQLPSPGPGGGSGFVSSGMTVETELEP